MQLRISKLAAWLGALGIVALLWALPGCGASIGLSYGDQPRWDDGFYGPSRPYDGLWYGEYVYYRGRWHMHGYNTPYYDPWGWYW